MYSYDNILAISLNIKTVIFILNNNTSLSNEIRKLFIFYIFFVRQEQA